MLAEKSEGNVTEENGQAIEIVTLVDEIEKDSRLLLNEKALESILAKTEGRPLGILCIAGRTRTGKSFLLSHMKNHLNSWIEAHSSSPPKRTEGSGSECSLSEENTKNPSKTRLSGFHWQCGSQRQTRGISIWSEPFMINLEGRPPFAILLMDTQGIFDDQTCSREWHMIIGLSMVISSCLIFNLWNDLSTDLIQHLEDYFSVTTILSHGDSPRSAIMKFQKLVFLIRDWCWPQEHNYGMAGGHDYFEKKFNPDSKNIKGESKEARKRIRNTFDEISCCLMIRPGDVVQDQNFDGSLQSINNPQFEASLREFFDNVINPETFPILKIADRLVTGSQLAKNIKMYCATFNDLPSFESAGNVYEKTYFTSVIKNCMELYMERMTGYLEGEKCTYFLQDQLQEFHTKVVAEVTTQFDNSSPGSLKHTFLSDLENSLTDSFTTFQQRNQDLLDKIREQAVTGFKKVVDDHVEKQCPCTSDHLHKIFYQALDTTCASFVRECGQKEADLENFLQQMTNQCVGQYWGNFLQSNEVFVLRTTSQLETQLSISQNNFDQDISHLIQNTELPDDVDVEKFLVDNGKAKISQIKNKFQSHFPPSYLVDMYSEKLSQNCEAMYDKAVDGYKRTILHRLVHKIVQEFGLNLEDGAKGTIDLEIFSQIQEELSKKSENCLKTSRLLEGLSRSCPQFLEEGTKLLAEELDRVVVEIRKNFENQRATIIQDFDKLVDNCVEKYCETMGTQSFKDEGYFESLEELTGAHEKVEATALYNFLKTVVKLHAPRVDKVAAQYEDSLKSKMAGKFKKITRLNERNNDIFELRETQLMTSVIQNYDSQIAKMPSITPMTNESFLKSLEAVLETCLQALEVEVSKLTLSPTMKAQIEAKADAKLKDLHAKSVSTFGETMEQKLENLLSQCLETYKKAMEAIYPGIEEEAFKNFNKKCQTESVEIFSKTVTPGQADNLTRLTVNMEDLFEKEIWPNFQQKCTQFKKSADDLVTTSIDEYGQKVDETVIKSGQCFQEDALTKHNQMAQDFVSQIFHSRMSELCQKYNFDPSTVSPFYDAQVQSQMTDKFKLLEETNKKNHENLNRAKETLWTTIATKFEKEIKSFLDDPETAADFEKLLQNYRNEASKLVDSHAQSSPPMSCQASQTLTGVKVEIEGKLKKMQEDAWIEFRGSQESRINRLVESCLVSYKSTMLQRPVWKEETFQNQHKEAEAKVLSRWKLYSLFPDEVKGRHEHRLTFGISKNYGEFREIFERRKKEIETDLTKIVQEAVSIYSKHFFGANENTLPDEFSHYTEQELDQKHKNAQVAAGDAFNSSINLLSSKQPEFRPQEDGKIYWGQVEQQISNKFHSQKQKSQGNEARLKTTLEDILEKIVKAYDQQIDKILESSREDFQREEDKTAKKLTDQFHHDVKALRCPDGPTVKNYKQKFETKLKECRSKAKLDFDQEEKVREQRREMAFLQIKEKYKNQMENRLAGPNYIKAADLQTFHDTLVTELVKDLGPAFSSKLFLEELQRDMKALYRNFEQKNLDKQNLNDVAVGIDLGTTNSCIAYYKRGEIEVFENPGGSKITPSYVYFQPDMKVAVGSVAVEKLQTDDYHAVAYETKRLIGRKFDDTVVQSDIQKWAFKVERDPQNSSLPVINIRGKTFRAEDIGGEILSHLKTNAELKIHKEIKKAVITVPAYFDNAQKDATLKAGEKAGLEILRILNEPTAAALAFGLANRDARKQNVFVFDLGGGTFDVSIVRLEAGNINVIAVDGDSHLGGVDFDNNLVTYCLNTFNESYKSSISSDQKDHLQKIARLRVVCEQTKKTLSDLTTESFSIPYFHGPNFLEMIISREKFEELNKHLFQICMDKTAQVLTEAKLTKEQIDVVILVGGSTKVPRIVEMVEKFFPGKLRQLEVNKDEVVARGAAIQAAILNGRSQDDSIKMNLNDVTPKSFGTSVEGGGYSIIIPKFEPVPSAKDYTKTYLTASDNQTSMDFTIFEGENPIAIENLKLDKFILSGIPKAKGGEQKVTATMKIDHNGILHISATSVGSGETAYLSIKRHCAG